MEDGEGVDDEDALPQTNTTQIALHIVTTPVSSFIECYPNGSRLCLKTILQGFVRTADDFKESLPCLKLVEFLRTLSILYNSMDACLLRRLVAAL